MNRKLTFVFSAIAMFLLLSSSFSNLFVKTEAIFCGDLGAGTGSKVNAIDTGSMNLPSAGGRTYTIFELFSNSFDYAIPNGQLTEESRTSNAFLKSENILVAEAVGGIDDAQKTRMERLGNDRNLIQCQIGSPIEVFFQDIGADMAGGTSNIIASFVGTLFDQDFICPDPAKPNGHCVNLLAIIGGKSKGDKTGIISRLSEGFFYPMTVVAFLFVAGWLMWVGLIQRKYREALNGFLWSLIALLIGVVIAVNPFLVARGPQMMNAAISDCILGVIGGTGCMGGSGNQILEGTISNVCESTASGLSGSSALTLKINSLNCSIVKAFTIERWAYQQFGYTFDELWTTGDANGNELYTKVHGNATDYCVNMQGGSPEQIKSNPKFSGAQKCNIALAYAAIKTQGDFGTKATMEQIIATAAKDEVMWSAFTGNGRTFMAYFLVILAIVICGISFIPLTIFAHVYSLTSTILMAFAPIYVLFGIHPGKGRRIFLGWVETVVSNILKYAASAIMVLIMTLIYGAAFAKLGQFQLFVASIVLSATFLSYRKEFVNLVGTVSMGGEKVRNMAEERLNKTGQGIKNTSTALIGGAIGGAVAEGSASGLVKGLKQGAGMQMRRGSGVIATAARAGQRISTQNKADEKQRQREAVEERRHQESLENQKAAATQANLDAERDIVKSNVNANTDYIETENTLAHFGQTDLADNQAKEKEKVLNATDLNSTLEAKTELDIKTENNRRLVNALSGASNVKSGLSNFADDYINRKEMEAINPSKTLNDTIAENKDNINIDRNLYDKSRFAADKLLNENVRLLDVGRNNINSSLGQDNKIDANKFHDSLSNINRDLQDNNQKIMNLNSSLETLKTADRNSFEYKQAEDFINKLVPEYAPMPAMPGETLRPLKSNGVLPDLNDIPTAKGPETNWTPKLEPIDKSNNVNDLKNNILGDDDSE